MTLTAARGHFRAPTARLAVTALAASSIVFALLMLAPHATSWHFFDDAAHNVFSAPTRGSEGGLDVYTEHPEYQFGPVSIFTALPFAYAPTPWGVDAATVFASLLGVASAVAIADTARRAIAWRGDTTRGELIGVTTLIIVWGDVAVRTTHLDDAVALAATTCALAATARNRGWSAVVLLGLAAAAKPWAIAFAPLVLMLPDHRLRRLTALGTLAIGAWLPFVLDEPGTVRATSSFTITNAASSALRAMGVASRSTPDWVRPTQLLVGAAAATLLVRTGRWHGAVMTAVSIRLLLDPGVHHYYTAGLVTGVLLWEAIERPHRIPIVTIASAVVCEMTSGHPSHPYAAGFLRLAMSAGLIVCAGRAAPVAPDPPVRRATARARARRATNVEWTGRVAVATG